MSLKDKLKKFPTVFKVLRGMKRLFFFFMPSRYSLEELAGSFFGWIPGRLGVYIRRIVWSFFVKEMGKGVTIYTGVSIRGSENIRFGNRVVIYSGTSLLAYGGALTVGERSNIGAHMLDASGSTITIGKCCALAAGVIMRSSNHNYSNPDIPIMDQEDYSGTIVLGNDVWIGANVSVLADAVIGDGCVIGAGAVVTRGYIPPYSVAVGVPAKVVKKRM